MHADQDPDEPQRRRPSPRDRRLSPEISELMGMLAALESRFLTAAEAAR